MSSWSHVLRGQVLSGEVHLDVLMFDVTVELPYVDTIVLTHCDDLAVVFGVENDIVDLVGVPDEALEEVGVSLLSLIVPHLNHAVFSTGQQVTRVVRNRK